MIDYAETAAVSLGAMVVFLVVTSWLNRRPTRPRLGLVRALPYAVSVLATAALAVTAFWGVFIHGQLHGWGLLVHVLAAGAFVIAFAITALVWLRPRADLGKVAALCQWLMLLCGIVTAGSMLAGMLPWFDTAGLERLLEVHRWSGLALTLATMLHLYLVRRRR